MEKNQKTWKEFFRGASIDRYSTEISARNDNNLRAFSILGIVMMSFAILFGWIMRDIFTFNTEFFIMWTYFLIMYIVTRPIRIHRKHVTATFYLWVAPIMIMGIIIGTFGDPTEPSITIMVFLCVIPMFILDKPWRIVLFIFLNSVVYTICCYLAKTIDLFAADMVDLVLFTVLGIGVNCLILRDRISNVEYAMDMMFMAETDALTGLNNRGAGEERVRHLIQQGKGGMFLLIDLDNFKNINDNYGHATGDKALRAVAMCLRQSFRDSDVVMRFGGDEFAVFAQSLKNHEDRKICIDHMMQKIQNFSISDMPDLSFSVSVGISFADPKRCKSFESIYRESDKALYLSKQKGKNSYSFFSESLV